MGKLQIITAPDPILTKKSAPINVVDNEIREFMDDLLETLYADKAVGLAANQVGVLKRVIVMDLKGDDDQERPDNFYPLFVANPEIIETYGDMVEADEGCMSVPDQRIAVARPEYIKIKFLDYNNKIQELETGGWLSRVIQHEIDHLDGKLMIDYLSKLKKNVILRRLTKIKKIS